MEWSFNGRIISHDRAFTSLGEENCLLRLQNVTQEDEGVYTCTICNKHGCCSSSARLTVIGELQSNACVFGGGERYMKGLGIFLENRENPAATQD